MNEIESQVDADEFIVLENVINPNYTKVENDIIGNKQAINSIENSMRVQNEYLAELDSMRNRLNTYYDTGDFEDLQSNILSVTKSNIYLPSAAVVPSRKTSPSNAKNVILGTLLGGMLGVLAALIKEYWFKKN